MPKLIIGLVIALIFFSVGAHFIIKSREFNWPYPIELVAECHNRDGVINSITKLSSPGVVFTDMLELKGFDILTYESGSNVYDQVVIYYNSNGDIKYLDLNHVNRGSGIMSSRNQYYLSNLKKD